MPIAATELITRAGNVLQDEDHVRWEVPELLEWINDAAREAIVRRPAARSVAAVLSLVAGTRQALPERGVELLDVVRNMGADGVTPGRIVRRVDRQLLDDQNPDWHSVRPKNVVKHFTFDERAPRIFYVYPPAIADTKVETLHSELPPAITAEGDTLDMGAEYMNVLVSYVCFRALSKDSEYANGTVAALHYQAFIDAVTDNNQQTTANSPNANSV
ncbi:structural protein [Burkholderia phage BcepMigl]|uniref:Virion associated protein n=1 Tax=Burkholderia phage BcepMigl TaxID=2886899 RepID=I6WLQ1_9CAUD|nr:structural protein [Burkholderia phage BcepMigl]AFN39123.1 virion associated protein [Burkholderia phage BcepMigl]